MPSNNKITEEIDLDTQKLIQVYPLITPLIESQEVKDFIRDQLNAVEDPQEHILWDSFIRNIFSKMIKARVDNIDLDYTNAIYNMQVSDKFDLFPRLPWVDLFKKLENDSQFMSMVDGCRKSLPFQINYVREVNNMLKNQLSSMTSKPIDSESIEPMLDTLSFASRTDEESQLKREIRHNFILLYLRLCIKQNVTTKEEANRQFENLQATFSRDYNENELLQLFVSNVDRDDKPVYDTALASNLSQLFFKKLLTPLNDESLRLAEFGIELTKNKILSTDAKIDLLREKLQILTETVGEKSEQLEKQSAQLKKQSEQLEKQSEQLNTQSQQLIKQNLLIERLIHMLQSPGSNPEQRANPTF